MRNDMIEAALEALHKLQVDDMLNHLQNDLDTHTLKFESMIYDNKEAYLEAFKNKDRDKLGHLLLKIHGLMEEEANGIDYPTREDL